MSDSIKVLCSSHYLMLTVSSGILLDVSDRWGKAINDYPGRYLHVNCLSGERAKKETSCDEARIPPLTSATKREQ